MTVLMQAPGVPIPPAVQKLDDIAKACNKKIQDEEDKRVAQKKKKATCQALGVAKHKCCEEEIQKQNDEDKKNGKTSEIEGEKCYNRPQFGKDGKVKTPVDTSTLPLDRGKVIAGAVQQAFTDHGPNPTRKQISKAIGKALAGKIFPDAAVVGPGDARTLVDFKFECPASHRSKRKSAVKNYRPPTQSPNQAASHTALGRATGGGETITIRW
jgi:hypothetical protein